MSVLNAIIIDDELNARETLKGLLQNYCKNVNVLAMANSIVSGMEAIQKYPPDIVFLDVELSPGKGFDLLEKIPEINFNVIFTTAYDKYALHAIKFSALDYLLKPIDIEELKLSVTKAEEKNKSHLQYKFLSDSLKSTGQHRKIMLPTTNGYIIEKIDEIIRCESDNSYTSFYFTGSRKTIVCRPLKDYEELFAPFNFSRIHQSHLVNMDHIRKINKNDGSYVEMTDGTVIAISRRKKEEFFMGILSKFKLSNKQ